MFAQVRVTVGRAGDGALLLSSAEELGDYPVTVLHSLRPWAAAGPDHPLVAERGPDGGVADASATVRRSPRRTRSARRCSTGASARPGRC